MKMNWQLLDANGELIMIVNCEYDAIDLGRELHGAKVISLDFDRQEATILEYED